MSSLLAATPIDAAALADQLARFRAIAPDRLAERLAEFPGGGPELFADLLVHRGDLTRFQADRALAGETRSLALGPYRLTGFAGLGTFGPAYAASHCDQPGVFRVHLFPLRSLWRARQAKQLARSLAKVQHPAVVPLSDADSANGLHYLAWPLVEGTTLSGRVAAGPLPVGEVVRLLATLAEALHACHARKIVHGAITPSAVVYDTSGAPRLLDLGAGAILTSNLEDEESLLDTLSGSFAAVEIIKFAAPELVDGKAASPEADQYALGALGYFALCGEAPFAAASLADVLASKAAGKPIPLAPDVPSELIATIERMLRTAAEERFPALDEVRARLLDLGGSPEPPPADPPSEPPAAEPLFNTYQSAGAGGSWGTPRPVADDLPPRDDSDASINFELPPPTLEPVIPPGRLSTPVSAVEISAVETPSQRHRETEAIRQEDSVRARTAAEVKVEPLAASPAPSTHPAPVETMGSAERIEPQRLGEPNPGNLLAPLAGSKAPLSPPQSREGLFPKSGIQSPVRVQMQPPGAALPPVPSDPPADDQPLSDSILWRKVKRSLRFWQTPMDVLQVSVFGPARVAPGQPAKLSVYLHTEEMIENVRTLSRAFHHDAELIGSGVVAREVARDTELAVHLSIANAGVSKSLQTLTWLGQPHRLVFDLHVPGESMGGPAPGLVSIGRENVRIGKVEFRLALMPRKG